MEDTLQVEVVDYKNLTKEKLIEVIPEISKFISKNLSTE